MEQYFCIDSKVRRKTIKTYIIRNNIKPYQCHLCKNNGEWQGKKISLQLDHINGINNDNRLQNLRFLCPNCHSQTQTYCGKNKDKKIIYLCQCGNKVCQKGRKCNKCRGKLQEKYIYTKETIQEKLKELNYNMSSLGKYFGVSDSAIRKRCKKLNIKYKVE